MHAWRSELAVPGSSERMIRKALASHADIVFIDLEDAVTPAEKPAARANVARALSSFDWGAKPAAFRINAIDTVWFYRDLIDVIEAAGPTIRLVVVPKVNRPADIYVVAALLSQLEIAARIQHTVRLEAQIETAEGLTNCERIAVASRRIEALTFGPGDFAASAGMPSTHIGMEDEWDARYPGHRWQYAMSRIVVAARAAGIRAIDGPFADYHDEDGLRRSCAVSRALGFDGKWCIHPRQIATVNEVFAASEDEIAWARRVLAAAQDAADAGLGAVAIDGRMIDGASIRMAERTLARKPAERG